MIWLWVATIELGVRKSLELVSISKERNMLLAERFVSSLVKIHGHQQPVSTDWMEVLGIDPQACKFLRSHLHRHIHSPYEKSIIIERKNNAVHDKRRTESFDDYFPCRKKNCNYYMCGIG